MPQRVDPSRAHAAASDRETVLRAAPAASLEDLRLSKEEAFLLSRFDRPMRVREILPLAALPESHALGVLVNLVVKGALLLPGDAPAPVAPRVPPPPSPYRDFVFSPSELNEDVDLDRDERKRILYLFHRLDEVSCFQLLGVTPTASAAELHRAYLLRSKELHPDRHFRSRLGNFRPRLDAIFQAVRRAYEILSDDQKRQAYERENTARFTAEERAAIVAREVERIEDEKRLKNRRERLLRTRGFAHLTKARELVQEGDEALGRGDLAEAINTYQRAQTLDPRLAEAREKLTEARKVAVARHAQTAMDEAARMQEEGETGRALELLTSAVELDPQNARAHLALAVALLGDGRAEARRARVHAERAIELGDKSPGTRAVLGEALFKCGMKKDARRALREAAEAGDSRAQALLKKC